MALVQWHMCCFVQDIRCVELSVLYVKCLGLEGGASSVSAALFKTLVSYSFSVLWVKYPWFRVTLVTCAVLHTQRDP